MAQAARQFVFDSQFPNGTDKVTVKIQFKGWGEVAGEPICSEDETTGDNYPCPNIIILGTTQIAGR
ncbi:hypothetical protein HK096_005772, partial [Nowakowskiella sp. JEL0078]